MTTLPELEPGALKAAHNAYYEHGGRALSLTSPDRLDAAIRAYLAARSAPEAGKAVEYTPQVIQFDDSGISELVLTDEMLIYGEVASVVVVRDKEGRIAGFQWFTKDIHNAGPKSALASSPAPTGAPVAKLGPYLWIDILREWFGGERYARDHEYLDANYSEQAKRVAAFLATPSFNIPLASPRPVAPIGEIAGLVDRLRDRASGYRSSRFLTIPAELLDEAAAALTASEAEAADLRRKLEEARKALDVADRLIERGYGIDTPDEWHAAYRTLSGASQ